MTNMTLDVKVETLAALWHCTGDVNWSARLGKA